VKLVKLMQFSVLVPDLETSSMRARFEIGLAENRRSPFET
jgi:hypothetical protein